MCNPINSGGFMENQPVPLSGPDKNSEYYLGHVPRATEAPTSSPAPEDDSVVMDIEQEEADIKKDDKQDLLKNVLKIRARTAISIVANIAKNAKETVSEIKPKQDLEPTPVPMPTLPPPEALTTGVPETYQELYNVDPPTNSMQDE